MKLIFNFLVVFCGFASLYAQDTIVKYFDENNQTCSESKYFIKQHVYVNVDSKYEVDKYYNTGYMAFKGQYQDSGLTTPMGMHFYYYENGFIEKELNYNEYGDLSGKSVYYHSNNRRDRSESYSKGIKDGKWIWYYKDGNIAWYELYRFEELVVIQKFDTNGEEILEGVAEMIAPKWNYSEEALNDYILNRVKRKKCYKQYESFLIFITTNGNVVDVKNIDGKQTRKAKELQRILEKGPEWIPGLEHLRPVDGILLYEIEK